MIWTKVSFETTTEAEDLLADFLNTEGVEGVLIEDNVPLSESDLREMFVDIPLVKEDDGKAVVSCFVPEGYDVDGLKSKTLDYLKEISGFMSVGSLNVMVEKTSDDSTWQDNWKEYFKPFRLYDDIIILPNWTEYDDIKEDDKVIRIESVSAFGTGTHETTKLCIKALKEYLKKDMDIIDIGCGSGILSIAGVYLGAAYVKGIDIDPRAVNASHENASVNGFSEDRIDFAVGNMLDDKSYEELCNDGRKYDIVVANILADVIIPLTEKVHPFMKEGGLYITSGIIDTMEEKTKEALIGNGFEIINTFEMNEWRAFVCRIQASRA